METVQAFQLGSSTVITLPKTLGIHPGQKFSLKKTNKKIVLKEEKLTEIEVEKLVKRLSGGLNFKYHPNPEELNKIFDEEYEDLLS